MSRSFKILHDRNLTLKETVLRRRRVRSTTLEALRGIDLSVAPGEALGIVGKNGSGKSTLLKLIAGIIPPDDGTVRVGGTIASMLELGAGFHPDFTGTENVYMNASIFGLSTSDVDARLDEIIAFAELAEFMDMPVRTYSSGMYMRLAFAIASHVNPDVLLLDEVLAVGDEAFQRKCLGRIFSFRRAGGTLIFVSHSSEAVEQVCDRAIVISDGRIVADGATSDAFSVYRKLITGTAPDVETTVGTDQLPADEGSGEALDGWGEGGARIVAARLCRADGEPADRFASGDSVVIEFDVVPEEVIEQPTYGMMVHSPDGGVIYGTNTKVEGVRTGTLSGPQTVRFELESLPLHEGRFEVSFAISSGDLSILHHWADRPLALLVFQQRSGVGMVTMSGQWSVGVPTMASTGG